MKLSIIIANYNYQDFVGTAISSALAVDWPAVPQVRVNRLGCSSEFEHVGNRSARQSTEQSSTRFP